MILFMRILTAGVWFVFGIGFKVLNLVPRHQVIVGMVLGERFARPMTVMIGLGEACIGVWVLTGYRPRVCAGVQTGAIVMMNALELTLAREHLLSPLGMVAANGVFLSMVWYSAIRAGKPGRDAAGNGG
jgi:uncharacterized membrane protein YphA (DoxX/SURF4 family)